MCNDWCGVGYGVVQGNCMGGYIGLFLASSSISSNSCQHHACNNILIVRFVTSITSAMLTVYTADLSKLVQCAQRVHVIGCIINTK